jgi:CheY-like chemotaxis protein
MKKVLFVGFTHIQIELARKFLIYRNLSSAIELLPEQQSPVPVDAYVVNGDDAAAPSRLGLYMRLYPRPVLGVGARAVPGVTTRVAGPFKPATAERLSQLLDARAPAAAAQTAQVLVVDDDELVRRTMTRGISEDGHRVDVAGSSDDAMALLLNNQYRLVFLDIRMPGMDPFAVCRRVKRSGNHKDCAVYMLTSGDGLFDKVRGAMAGCDGYLVKPLESSALREVVDRHFDHPDLINPAAFI